jgi:hypothetical protein
MDLIAPAGDPERAGHRVQLVGIVSQQMGPAVLAVADGGPLPPVVDVDGQVVRSTDGPAGPASACATSDR